MKREALLEMHSGYQDERIAELEREVLELKEELALERAKAVSRHDFLASLFVGES